MKKIGWWLGVLCVTLPLGAVDISSIKQERDEKISAITAQVRDIDARYWAERILQSKDVSLEELQRESIHWLGTSQENEKLLSLVEMYVRKGTFPKINAEERKKLDENKAQVRAFLNNGRENPAAVALAEKNRQIREIKEPVFDLEARYWAWRVARVKDVSLEELKRNSESWVGEASYNRQLMEAVEKNIKTGNTKPLSRKEKKRFSQAQEAVRALLQK